MTQIENAAPMENKSVYVELGRLEDALASEAEFVRESKRRWMRWGPMLSALAALGSFGGGAAVALSDQLSVTARIVVVAFAIVFGAAGAAAAALRAPERVSEFQRLLDKLDAAERWTRIVRDVSLPSAGLDTARQLLIDVVTWVDEIHGVEAPKELRRPVDSENSMVP